MAQENVEIVRSMLEAWEADGFEAAKDAFDAEVEVVDLQSAMGMRDRARGPEELLRMTEQWTDIFDDWGMEVSDLVDLGGDFVLAEVSFSGVGRDSGIPVSNRQFEVYRLVGADSRAQWRDVNRRPRFRATGSMRPSDWPRDDRDR